MTHATKNNNEIKFVNLPDSFGEISYGYKNRTDLHGTDGFYKVIKPQLNEGEMYLPLELSDFNDETFEAVYRVAQLPQKTAQQLYDELIEQGKTVFDEFSIELSKAAIPYNILNNHPEELKELTRQLLAVKEEIKTGLKYYLDNNMIEKLKNFNFYDQRAIRLKEAIEKFK